jgi:hypothetical protein
MTEDERIIMESEELTGEAKRAMWGALIAGFGVGLMTGVFVTWLLLR